jgi:GNAT superfamily N-acetyltransferase
MRESVVIRPIEPSDSLQELTDLLHRAYASLGQMGLNYTAVDQPPETTARRISRGQCFVAADGTRLIGTIVVEPPNPDSPCEYFASEGVASAHQLAVAPENQRSGLGVALLERAEAWARDRGFRELAIDTAEPAEHLRSFYGRRGYRHVGFVQWQGKVYRSVVLSKELKHAA